MQIADNGKFRIPAIHGSGQHVDAPSTIVIDTPGSDSYLMRLAHSMADTLVTPINDSFLDSNVLGTVDPATYSVTGGKPLFGDGCGMSAASGASRRRSTDWIVVRNRLSMIGSRTAAGGRRLKDLSLRLGFRSIDGFAERVVYREFFPPG